ncbi:MAG: type I restriction enzyme EcoKI subunit R [Candidatus Methanoperedens nitroreducens]|uniref:Type I restriction enzyme EcoKI subunit R n=1 Tax=Candidatus Methanoperedens nitratireducens TaxID=1392998 RepID=A0A0P8AAZ8_9EURY|nr:MAG: type I restriction enzyme EcoKI subunit R [Candidatus Methanoperedens sp. BLZ1]
MARTKSKTELFGKHPLAKAIEPVIEKWSADNYPEVNGKQITHATRELMDYWFSDMSHEGEAFHICQRRAIETIIYCYEILSIPHVEELFEQFSCELLEKENLRHGIESMDHPRFAIKMATGTGKTWVLTALIIWQYWNRTKLNDKRFASHFLLVAPGNIVYERLLDSFLGKKRNGKRQPMTADLKKSLFMPENVRQDFDLRIFSKEDLQENTPFTEAPFLLITNWHQLMDTSREKEITLAEDLGIESRENTVSQRVERFMDFLTYNGDLMVINDEAHHVHNASDAEQKRWQESIEELREKIKSNKDSLFTQLDFTATPFTIKGKKKEFFPHVVYDYGLVEAMHAMLVKQLFIEKSSLLSNKIESLPEYEKLMITAHRDESNKPIELSEVQKHMLDIGLAKLDALQDDFNKFKINKKPVMFVMADMNEEANMIADYIRQKTDSSGKSFGDDSKGEQIVTLHIGKKDSLSEEDFETLRNKVFSSDDASNPVRVIVSVLMLREGFDVKNVCVLVVLRRSDSDLLTEQVIGRGIRQMFPEPEYRAEKSENYQKIKNKEPLINSYDLLFIVEHPKYNEIYTQLTEAGAAIASGNSIDLSLDTKSVLIKIDESRIKAFDISWPVSFAYKTEESIDFSYFGISELPLFEIPFEKIMQTRILITDFHPDTKYRREWELEESNFSYNVFLRNTVKGIIGGNRRTAWLTRFAPDIIGIVDQYISGHLFGRKIDFNLDENLRRLRNQQVFDFVITEVRKKLMKFVQNAKSNEVVEADWTKLSTFKTLKIRMERAIATKKCVYPFVDFPPRGGFERKFTENVLENDSSVEAYVKLNQYVHQFSIPYINNMGHLVPYYPDFLVKTRDSIYIIETKSTKEAANDIDTKIKAIAASGICSKISIVKNIPETNQPRIWNYVLLPQNIFDEMEDTGLTSLIERCEANLALLKMRRE